MSTEESRTLDEMAWRPKKVEYAISVAITVVIAGKTVTGQADFSHESVEGEDLDYCNMSISWFEGNCERNNVSWGVQDMMLLTVLAFPLSSLEAVAESFNFDVEYQEV